MAYIICIYYIKHSLVQVSYIEQSFLFCNLFLCDKFLTLIIHHKK